MNTFNEGLKYERTWWPRADALYKELFPNKVIYRPDWNNGGNLQRHDVDVVLRNPTGWPGEWMISEKFRSQPWDDLLVELYSDYDKKKPGWGTDSVAHEHFFFFEDGEDSYVRIVPTVNLRHAANYILRQLGREIEDASQKTTSTTLKLDGHDIKVVFVPTFGPDKKILWRGCCVAITDEILDYLNIEVKTIKLNKCNTPENK
jgi:hypothetical protein